MHLHNSICSSINNNANEGLLSTSILNLRLDKNLYKYFDKYRPKYRKQKTLPARLVKCELAEKGYSTRYVRRLKSEKH